MIQSPQYNGESRVACRQQRSARRVWSPVSAQQTTPNSSYLPILSVTRKFSLVDSLVLHIPGPGWNPFSLSHRVSQLRLICIGNEVWGPPWWVIPGHRVAAPGLFLGDDRLRRSVPCVASETPAHESSSHREMRHLPPTPGATPDVSTEDDSRNKGQCCGREPTKAKG